MFTVYHRSESNPHNSEYIKGDFGLALGSAAVVRNGKLVKASQNECPEYIVASCQCMNGTYAAVRVNRDTVFATPCIGGGDVLTGVKVMISEDAGGVTNTPGGAFLIDGVINHLKPSGTPIVKDRFVPESDERSTSDIKRVPLTLDQLKHMVYEENCTNVIKLHDIKLNIYFAAIVDILHKHGVCAVYSAGTVEYKEDDYGKTWVAYPYNPVCVVRLVGKRKRKNIKGESK